MKNLKLFALVAAMAAAFATSTASATTLNLPAEYPIAAEAEGTTILHPPIGDIECKGSSISGKTSNEGGASETVKGNIESLSWSECNATVTVLAKGTLEVHTRTESADGNGTLTSNGTEVTVEFAGFHCIFKTSNTDIGTVTGTQNTEGNATLDIAATVPRTGGRSGAFCGSTAQWTGSYKFTSPSALNVDGRGLQIKRASTPNGGQNAPKCIFKAATEICEVEVENTEGFALTIANPEFLLGNSTTFEEVAGKVGMLPECNAGTVLAAGAKCGKKIKSTNAKDVGPGVGGTFRSNWIFQGTVGGVSRAQATTFLEWRE